jgi:hypothetical protein
MVRRESQVVTSTEPLPYLHAILNQIMIRGLNTLCPDRSVVSGTLKY